MLAYAICKKMKGSLWESGRERGLHPYYYASDSRMSKVGSIAFIVCLVGCLAYRIGIELDGIGL